MNSTTFQPNLIGGSIEHFASPSTGVKHNEKKTAAEIESVGQQFEGVFLSLLLKEMRNTLGEGGFFGEENSDTYGGLFDLFVGESLADSKPLGISEILVSNYEKVQSAFDTTVGSATPAADSLKAPAFRGVY